MVLGLGRLHHLCCRRGRPPYSGECDGDNDEEKDEEDNDGNDDEDYDDEDDEDVHVFCTQVRHRLHIPGSPLVDFFISFCVWPSVVLQVVMIVTMRMV